jgi:tetratricopeptide (TPR) repeat protein
MAKTIQEAEMLFNKAFDFYKGKKSREALLTLKELLFMAKGEIRVKAYELLAKICVDKSKLDDAVTFYLNALKHAEPENWPQKIVLYNNIGLLYQSMHKLEDAIKYQELCLEGANKDGNKKAVSMTLRNLGRLYTLKGDHVNALRSHQKSLELRRVMGDFEGEARNYETIAQDFEYDEKYNEAIAEYQKALTIYEKLGLHPDHKRIARAIESAKELAEHSTDYDDSEMYEMKAGNFL